MMRKYLAATALGAMLIAGQAAASDSAVVNLGDRIGSQTTSAENWEGGNALLIALAAALFIGLIAWGFSQGGNGTPATP
jgi:ABC-type spermidine/putrescine transport system permease subunit I